MKIETIGDLKTAIEGIIVKDYGDFKRKTILYLNRFEENHKGPFTDPAQQKMRELKWHVQFHPSGEIETTRRWALDEIDELNTALDQ